MIRLLMIVLALLAGAPAIAQTPPDYRPGGATTSTNPLPVQLRCWDGVAGSWRSCAGDVSRGAGTVDANTTRVTVASDGPLMTATGTPSDAAWGGTGNATIIAALKAIYSVGATPRAAISTACTAVVTSGAATPTGCSASGGAGSYVVGPFSPSPGYPVRLVATGTWSGSITIGTSINNCSTLNGLTVAGVAYGVFTGNANEAVDVPATTGGVSYCASITVTSGTLTLALRQ